MDTTIWMLCLKVGLVRTPYTILPPQYLHVPHMTLSGSLLLWLKKQLMSTYRVSFLTATPLKVQLVSKFWHFQGVSHSRRRHLGIAQLAFAPPAPHSNGHSGALFLSAAIDAIGHPGKRLDLPHLGNAQMSSAWMWVGLPLRTFVGKGLLSVPYLMNFRKTSKRPLTPHPIFGKQCWAFFGRPKNLQRNSFGLAWPPPFFRKFIVFTAPKFPEKPQRNFSDRKWPPPPLGSFPKIHWIWYR